MKSILIINFLLLIFNIYSQTINEPRWINADVGLRMRKDPDLEADKIGVIPYGEKVILLEEVGQNIKIAGAVGKWSKVDWNGKIGWVFGGFLSKSEIIITNLDLLSHFSDNLWIPVFWSHGDYIIDGESRRSVFKISSGEIITGYTYQESYEIRNVTKKDNVYIFNIKYLDENKELKLKIINNEICRLDGVLLKGLYAKKSKKYYKVFDDGYTENISIYDKLVGSYPFWDNSQTTLNKDFTVDYIDPGDGFKGNWKYDPNTKKITILYNKRLNWDGTETDYNHKIILHVLGIHKKYLLIDDGESKYIKVIPRYVH